MFGRACPLATHSRFGIMGHVRLGTVPKSQPWRAVVSAVMGGVHEPGGGPSTGTSTGTGASETGQKRPELEGQVAEIAARTLEATEAGLAKALNDEGLQHTFYLLTQLALASRAADWRERLEPLGLRLPADANAFVGGASWAPLQAVFLDMVTSPKEFSVEPLDHVSELPRLGCDNIGCSWMDPETRTAYISLADVGKLGMAYGRCGWGRLIPWSPHYDLPGLVVHELIGHGAQLRIPGITRNASHSKPGFWDNENVYHRNMGQPEACSAKEGK